MILIFYLLNKYLKNFDTTSQFIIVAIPAKALIIAAIIIQDSLTKIYIYFYIIVAMKFLVL